MKKVLNFNEYNLNEYHDQRLTDTELTEMANYWGGNLGLDDNIVLWIGSVLSSQHNYGGNRIKVSNIPGRGRSSENCFTITVPKLEIIGNVNKSHITTKKLNTIFEFIKLNQDAIIDICQEKIDSIEFASRIKKYVDKKDYDKLLLNLTKQARNQLNDQENLDGAFSDYCDIGCDILSDLLVNNNIKHCIVYGEVKHKYKDSKTDYYGHTWIEVELEGDIIILDPTNEQFDMNKFDYKSTDKEYNKYNKYKTISCK